MHAKRVTVRVAAVLAKKTVARAVAVLAKRMAAKAVAMLARKTAARELTKRATAKPLLQCHQHQLSILRLT